MSAFEGIETADSRRGPVASLEFRRILDIPRRVWHQAEDLEALRLGLTQYLRAPGGTWELLTTQAAALREIYDRQGGIFGPIGVGEGKTLILLLAPLLLEAERPLLLVPAALRDQTNRYVLPAMREQWQLHPGLLVMGYEELSLAKNSGFLETLQPDLIMADECQNLKSLRSGRTRRVSRYMRDHPDTAFIALSGTVANHSILDYWHLIQWALKPGNAPLPRSWHEVQEWSLALDERVREEDRLGPGALQALCEPGENVRQGYRRRLTETPGVIATDAGKLGVSLQLIGRSALSVPAEIVRRIRAVGDTWETPDGDVITEAVQIWQITRALVCGFYRRWIEKPPQEWLESRRAWNHFVQYTLQHNRRKLDTPLQVWRATEALGNCRELERWNLVKDTFEPTKEDVWVSDYLVEDACRWLSEGPGICWVEYPALGKRIAEASGHPYFGAGDSHIAEASGPVVASIAAHGTGKNLQQWSRNLVLTPPTSGDAWEQLLGRTHRIGQLADTVVAEVSVHHPVYQAAMEQAFADARFLQDSLGNKQRLLYCDTDLRR